MQHHSDERALMWRARWDRFLREGAAGIPAPVIGGSIAVAAVIMLLVAVTITSAIRRERRESEAVAERAAARQRSEEAERIWNSPEEVAKRAEARRRELAAAESQRAADAEARKAEAQMQTDREAALQEMTLLGLIAKHERKASNLAQVWVPARFYTLTFDQKQTIVSVIFAYYFDGKGGMQRVEVVDNMDGKVIGRFSVQDGGLKIF